MDFSLIQTLTQTRSQKEDGDAVEATPCSAVVPYQKTHLHARAHTHI